MRSFVLLGLVLAACGTSLPSPDTTSDAITAHDPDAADVLPDAAKDSGGLPAMVMPAYLVGYNEAWFGDNFASDLTTNFDSAYVDRTLDGIVAGHGHVMRLFVFELGQGIMWDAQSAAPRTRGIDPTFLAHLDYVLTAARARGLWVYVPALEASDAYCGPVGTVAYFHDLVTNVNGELQSFESLVMDPLVALLVTHADNVYALDLANEIEAPIQHDVWSDRWAAPRAFMQNLRAYVKARAPNLKVTVSAGIGNPTTDVALGLFSGIGLDFYDIHEYSDSGQYSGATSVCDRAEQDGVFVVLGEFGQSSKTIDDNLQLASTTEFLGNSRALCFKAALGWRYDYSAIAGSNWFNYVRADGTLRPAASVFENY